MARPPELCAGESRNLGIVASEGHEGAPGGGARARSAWSGDETALIALALRAQLKWRLLTVNPYKANPSMAEPFYGQIGIVVVYKKGRA